MTGLGEIMVSATALVGTLLLTLGIGAIAFTRRVQMKVHALSLALVGPLVVLLSVPFWGDLGMALTALVLAAFLTVASAVSAHAIMGLVRVQRGGETGPRGGHGERGEKPATDFGEGDGPAGGSG